MRGSPLAWLRPLPPIALIISLVGCSISLRGVANPGSSFATATPFVAGGPPSVEIAAPANGEAFRTGDMVDVDVRGSDSWPVGVNRLELFAAGQLVDRRLTSGAANQQEFDATLEWTPTAPGNVLLSAYAYRADGTASVPATVNVVVSGNAVQPSATPSIVPLPSDSPLGSFSPTPSTTDIPTVTLSPSPPPTPTPPPTPRPTPTPTPAPIGVHIDVWVEPADIPDFTVGVRSIMKVHVQNIGANSVPYIRVTASLAGDSFRARTSALRPGDETIISVALTPSSSGFQTLSVVGKLPPGYFDTDPQSNTLVWDTSVFVNPGSTPPPPTPSPSPPGQPSASP